MALICNLSDSFKVVGLNDATVLVCYLTNNLIIKNGRPANQNMGQRSPRQGKNLTYGL